MVGRGVGGGGDVTWVLLSVITVMRARRDVGIFMVEMDVMCRLRDIV